MNAAVDLHRFKNHAAIEQITGQIKRDHRMMHVDLDPDGTYRVLSWSRPGVVYEVIGDACHCEAAQANLICWHVLAANLDRHGRRPIVSSTQAAGRELTRIPVADLSPDERDYEAVRLGSLLFDL